MNNRFFFYAFSALLMISLFFVSLTMTSLVHSRIIGDIDNDQDVDKNDLSLLLADRDKTVGASTCGALCDLDGDGRITVLDARRLVSSYCDLALCKVNTPPIVQLSATATDADNHPLNFEWRVTDGELLSHSGTNVEWQLPDGPGLHFAYVLVGDEHGGYTEKRVVVSTDDIGTDKVALGGPEISAPAAPYVKGSILRTHMYKEAIWEDSVGLFTDRNVHPAGVWVQAYDEATNLPIGDPVLLDSKGEMVIPKVSAGINPFFKCSVDGVNFTDCEDDFNLVTGERADIEYSFGGSEFEAPDEGLQLFGHVVQADGTLCGMRNYFFDRDVMPTVRIKDSGGNPIGVDRAWAVNAYGDYWVPTGLTPDQLPLAATIELTCENAIVSRDVTLSSNHPIAYKSDSLTDIQFFVDFTVPNHSPVVTSMTATYNGDVIATLPPPASPQPTDAIEDAERFFSFKGIDSRQSACQYYRAIGAISGCDADGNLLDGITFDRWKQTHGMAPYNIGDEYSAVFINAVDLNLTRRHHGTKVDANHLAFYVCNHLGPTDASQAAINTAIDNAMASRNLIACVAMDYSINPGVNNDQPFIKYLIFGGSGELLPSINLDGRREKFVPGVCVGCHGGEHYAGKYPEDGSGDAHVGASNLPYDVDNFRFSSKPGLTREDQLAQIRQLNQLLPDTKPHQAMVNLIHAWYAHGGDEPDESYAPAAYEKSEIDRSYYQNLVKPYCRTCHIAYGGNYNSDNSILTGQSRICGGSYSPYRHGSMPNSPVTYNLMVNNGGLEAFFAPDPVPPDCQDPPAPANLWPSQ